MTPLTRYWTIHIPIPDGAFEGYPTAHRHIETYGASANAFWRVHEIRSMMDEGVIPTLPIYLVSEPA